MKTRSWMILSICLLLVLVMPSRQAWAADWDPQQAVRELPVNAETAAVIDVQSGRILYGKDMKKQMRIASLTKIITAIVAIESGRLEETVTVSKNAYKVEGSSIFLELGEKQKLIDLIYAIMLRSGNDAATAVAEHVGNGSVEKFVQMMNDKVKQLGLTGTHFMNPHGLDAEGHYSTASDMAVLTAYALKNPVFAEIVSTEIKKIPWEGKDWERTMRNKNKMLYRYNGADGVKTGYTKAAGRCLATSATRDGRQLAVIVLNDRDDWNDTAKLLDYGFKQFQYISAVDGSETVTTLPVKNGTTGEITIKAADKLLYPVREDEKNQLTRKVKLPDYVRAPVTEGEQVGEMTVYLNNQKIGTIPLLAGASVEGTGWFEKLKRWLKSHW